MVERRLTGMLAAAGVLLVLFVLWDAFKPAPRPLPPPEPEVIVTKDFDPVKAELEAFATAIRDHKPFVISHDEIRHVTAAFEAIVKSAATGNPVKVS